MDRIPIVVGLDYHQDTVQVAIMKASNKPEHLANVKLPNSVPVIRAFVERFGRVVRCGIEACSGAADLAEQLITQAGWPVDLAHPGITSRMRHSPDKSDFSDGQIIADLARVGYLPTVWLAPAPLRELRLLVRDRTSLVRQGRRLRQQIGALLREHRRRGEHRRWSAPWVAWVKAVELPEHSRWILDRQLARLEAQGRELALTNARLTQATANDPVVQRLLARRGLGKVTAWILRAYVGNFQRFGTGKQLSKYCGLSPRNASTGTRQADAGVIRCANGDLRSALIEVAWSLIRHQERWKTLARDLRARGKPANVVAVAVANRFVRQLWHELTSPDVPAATPLKSPKTPKAPAPV